MTNKEILELIEQLGMVEEKEEIDKVDFTNLTEVICFVDELVAFNDTTTIEKLLTCILFEKEK